MIFVTVGTTKFEELVKKIDKIAPELGENVLIQLGNGKYKPRNCKWFRFSPNLDKYYKKADLVISHDGAGTLFELINLGKRVVALENKETIHNPDLVRKFSEEKHLIYCKDIENLKDCIYKAKRYKFKKYRQPKNEICKKLINFLKELERR